MDIVYENKSTLMSYSLDKGLSSYAHLHKELEVVYVSEGKAVAYADKNSYVLNEGDIFIAFPNQVHYYRTVNEGGFMVLIFSPDIIFGYSSEISQSIPDKNYVSSAEMGELKELFDKIHIADGKYKTLSISGYVNVMMSLLLPKLTLRTVTAEKNSTFYNVINFCTQNFKSDITLDIVAEKLHLSKYYISHLINNQLKQNFNEYINNLRIAEACNLLRESETKIADISEDVGFGTIRSFNRAFKLIMGVSPTEYRSNSKVLKNLTQSD